MVFLYCGREVVVVVVLVVEVEKLVVVGMLVVDREKMAAVGDKGGGREQQL